MKKKIKMLLSTISPTLTSKILYYYNFHKPLNLKNPVDINEKLQFLKLKTYYNNPAITRCVDKYTVRSYLEQHGHDELLPELIGGPYNNAIEIKKHWNEYPDKFVIKCNHGSGYNVLVSCKSKFNVDEVVKTVNAWMKEDYWKIFCEPQYRFIEKRIIVEEYLADDIKTYKFYCFNGEPEVLYISSNRGKEKDYYFDYYDMDMKWKDITLYPHEHVPKKDEKPKNFDRMVELARELSSHFPFVRIDLYNVNGNIYFSEFTFIPTGGIMKLSPETYIEDWGRILDISDFL